MTAACAYRELLANLIIDGKTRETNAMPQVPTSGSATSRPRLLSCRTPGV